MTTNLLSINTEKQIHRVEISLEDTEKQIPRLETKSEERNRDQEIRINKRIKSERKGKVRKFKLKIWKVNQRVIL